MRMTLKGALALTLTSGMLACSEPAEPPPLILDPPDQPHDQGEAQDQAQDLTSDALEDLEPPPNPCPSQITWRADEPLPGSARDHHLTLITTRGGVAKLHVLGGTDYTTFLQDHWVATISEDGTLGPWREGVPLPEASSGQALAQVGDEVYVMGGRLASHMLASVWRARFDDDGEISGWDPGPSLPAPRFHASAATHGRTIYVSGGLQGDGVAQPSLYRAEVASDGSLGEWTSLSLPQPRSHHASFAHDDHLYLVLGFQGNPFNNQTQAHLNVMRAPITAQGVGEWRVVAASQVERSTHATTVIGDCAITSGGLELRAGLPHYLSSVRGLSLGAEGEWDDTLDDFSVGRSHMHHAPYHQGRLYIVGGSERQRVVLNTVEIGTVTSAE